jgi:hypothetical protein
MKSGSRGWFNGLTEEELTYYEARREYAFMLRCEGLTYKKIGERLGISHHRTSQLVWGFAKRLAQAMKQTRVTFGGNDEHCTTGH